MSPGSSGPLEPMRPRRRRPLVAAGAALLGLASLVAVAAPAGADVPAAGCTTGPLGGVDIAGLSNDLFTFVDARQDANWQAASPGYVGDVTVDGLEAAERTSGTVPYAGTLSTSAWSQGAWQRILDANAGQATGVGFQWGLVESRQAELNAAFTQINQLPANYSLSASQLNGLDASNGTNETIVVNVTSGFQVSSKLTVSGDPGDVFVLRWDTDANGTNGYQGQVKFQSGGAIVPAGGLTPGNFINVAGDIKSSGGGSNPAAPYPQGPRLDNGQGPLIQGGSNFHGGGFFTGYWLTTGAPTNPADESHSVPYGPTSSLSNGIFVGGWYSITTQFSMTSGTAGVHVCENPAAIRGGVNPDT